jgi:hypothetical protein
MTTATHRLLDILTPTAALQRVSPDESQAWFDDGTAVTIWWYRTPQHARTAVSVLQRLHGATALPTLRAADIQGALVERPAVVIAHPSGAPLQQIGHRLTQRQLHAVGKQLGQLMASIHQHTVPHYGSLIGAGQHSHAAWLSEKATQACDRLHDAGIATRAECGAVTTVVQSTYTGDERAACLVHGQLAPADIWVLARGDEYRITAITGWHAAFGGRPAAEHVRLADACAAELWQPLRIGYGDAYDEACQRPIDQLRERSLLPDRLVWMLMRAGTAAFRAERNEAAACFLIVKRWCEALAASTTTREEE